MNFSHVLNKNGSIIPSKEKALTQDPEYIKLKEKYYWTKSLKELIHCQNNEILEPPKCHCGNHINFHRNSYLKSCSRKCISSNPDVKQIKSIKSAKLQAQKIQEYQRKYPWIESITEGKYCESIGLTERPKCPCCQKEVPFTKGKYSARCSYSCANKMDAAARSITYKKTCMEKYGVENFSQSKEFKEMVPAILEKAKLTNLKKYGATSYNQIKSVGLDLLDSKEYLYEKYVTNLFPLYALAEDHQVSQPYIKKCLLKHGIAIREEDWKRSFWEDRAINYIRTISPDILIEKNVRGLLTNNREIDILVDKKFAIEIDSLYWHSYNKKETTIEKFKHQYKKTECIDKSIQMFQIWTHEWKLKRTREIWMSKISQAILGAKKTYFARKLEIKTIDQKTCNNFLSENHLQGKCRATVSYGLFDKVDGLISVMTFGKSRFDRNVDWELIRFCSKKYCQVIGGASRLLKHFERSEFAPKKIVSYANLRWSDGNVYKVLGFEQLRVSAPNYCYTDSSGHKILPRYRCQKHKLKNLLGETSFDPEKSESENMFQAGYRRFWDSGNLVFLKTYD